LNKAIEDGNSLNKAIKNKISSKFDRFSNQNIGALY